MSSSRDRLPVTRNIADLLPHAPPMRWLDELVELGDDFIVARVAIREDALLYEASLGMPAWVGIEYMAQAVAAFSGHEDRAQGRSPHIGLLLGCRRYSCDRSHFPAGANLSVRAKLTLRDEFDLVAFDCTIALHDVIIAHGDVKAIRPQDMTPVLERAAGPDERLDGPLN